MIDDVLRGGRFGVLLLVAVFLSGCNIFGFIAAKSQSDVRVTAAYNDLHGQSVAILVDADERQHLEHPDLETDLAKYIKTCLQESKAKELEKTKYQDPDKIAQFQAAYPQLRGLPPTEYAHMLGVTRVIWVEVRTFSTREDVAVELLRGAGNCNLRVIEVKPQVADSAKITWSENDIGARYPDQEGERQNEVILPGANDTAQSVYQKTCETMALRIAEHFYEHDQNESIGAAQ